jgi:hypothetical protein
MRGSGGLTGPAAFPSQSCHGWGWGPAFTSSVHACRPPAPGATAQWRARAETAAPPGPASCRATPPRTQIYDNLAVRAKGGRRGKQIHLGSYDSEEAAARRAGGLRFSDVRRARTRTGALPAWGACPNPRRRRGCLHPPQHHPRVCDRAAIAFHKRDADLNVCLGRGGVYSGRGAANACWAMRTRGAAGHQPGPACPQSSAAKQTPAKLHSKTA